MILIHDWKSPALKAVIVALVALASPTALRAQEPPAPDAPPELPEPPVPAPAFPGQTNAPSPPISSAYSTEVIASRLTHPWAVGFLPKGAFLVTERPGRLRMISRTGKVSAPIAGLPIKAGAPGANLLDLAIDPDFAKNRLIYFNYSAPRPVGQALTVAKARLSLDGRRLEHVQVILAAKPDNLAKLGSDGRITLAPDGKIFMSSGSPRGFGQKLDASLGVMIRVNPDGSIPADNPFVHTAKARPEIYSYGHRDPQGLTINPDTKALWSVEHGPRGGDEINIIHPGLNYGWPEVTYGYNYDKSYIGPTARAGVEQPLYYWYPSIAPSGMTFYSGDKFPDWKGDLLVGSLKGKHISRLTLKDNKVVSEEQLLGARGKRIRDVRQGPDGLVYVLTDEDNGELLVIRPVQP